MEQLDCLKWAHQVTDTPPNVDPNEVTFDITSVCRPGEHEPVWMVVVMLVLLVSAVAFPTCLIQDLLRKQRERFASRMPT